MMDCQAEQKFSPFLCAGIVRTHVVGGIYEGPLVFEISHI